MIRTVLHRKAVLFCICFLLGFDSIAAATTDAGRFHWQIGELLSYKVSWGFLRLGTVTLQIVDTTRIENELVYHIRMNIDSNPWLFFVSMHSRIDSYLRPDTSPVALICTEEFEGQSYESHYRYDFLNRRIHVRYNHLDSPEKSFEKEIPMQSDIHDGMSIIFYARLNCDGTGAEEIMVAQKDTQGVLEINFTGESEPLTIAAVDNPVKTCYLEGEAHFKAIAGFTGRFEGWFSKDVQHVPLMAKMEVFIGKVTLELEDYSNWNDAIAGQ